jgi:L-arabinose isomerase
MHEPFSYRPARPRVAVIGGMMAYFETIMPPGFRDERRDHVAQVSAGLEPAFDLVDLGLWAEQGDARPIAQRLAEMPCDVLLLIPTMATPPAELAALAGSLDVPIVILCGHALDRVGEDYDMAALCRHSTNVGTTMLGAMLRRHETPIRPILVAGFLGDEEFHRRAHMAVRTAALAGQMQGLRAGRLGAPMVGYDHLGLSAQQASTSGVTIDDIPLDDWAARIAAITDDEINIAVNEILPTLLPAQARYTRTVDLDRAMRLALALDRLASEQKMDCGAIACRGPFGDGLDLGAISCLATTLMAATGRPFAATGDMVTAIAMLIGRTLGGATLYCELDAIDRSRDAFLVANTGEADIGWCPEGGGFDIHDASEHSGRQVPGVVLNTDLACVPATMLGVTLDRNRSDKLCLIALEGQTLESAKTALKVTHGWFQSDHRPALSAFEAWANAGATHHGSLSPGKLAEATRWLGMTCALPVQTITQTGIQHD